MPDQTTAVPLPEPAGWIWKYANGEEEIVFVDAAKITWDPTVDDVPTVVTPLHTSAQLLAYGDRRAAEERGRCLAEIECGLWIDMTTEEILDSIADAIRKGA